MNILRFDLDKYSIEEIEEIYIKLKEKLNGDLIAIPKDWELLLNVSINDLYYFRDKISEAINNKEINE